MPLSLAALELHFIFLVQEKIRRAVFLKYVLLNRKKEEVEKKEKQQ